MVATLWRDLVKWALLFLLAGLAALAVSAAGQEQCLHLDAVYKGGWVFGTSLVNTSFSGCPAFKKRLEGQDAQYQIGHYHCPKGFKRAIYKNSHCNVMPMDESIKVLFDYVKRKLQLNTLKIIFVGDSIGLQHYVAAGCDFEHHLIQETFHSTGKIYVDYFHDHVLRFDIPCNKKCVNDDKYRAKYLASGPRPCSACKDGVQKNFDPDSPLYWPQQIDQDSSIIILNSGVWYNNFQNFADDYEKVYKSTLELTIAAAKRLQAKGKIVLWVAMPPTEDPNPKFEWDSFQGRNDIARKMLEPHGIIFIDGMYIMRARKRWDPAWSKDGLHWCNPGMFPEQSAPSIINRALLHLAAIRALNLSGGALSRTPPSSSLSTSSGYEQGISYRNHNLKDKMKKLEQQVVYQRQSLKACRGNGSTLSLPRLLDKDTTPFDFHIIESKRKKVYDKDPFSTAWLSVLDELLLRKSATWFAGGTKGLYIDSAQLLNQRLDLARKVHKRDCRRTNILLLMCVIVKNDDLDLQEWLVWQIAVVGAHHIIVYVNVPVNDYTFEVLEPFVQAGFVSIVKLFGARQQPQAYKHCVQVIRMNVCNYPGYGPITGKGSEHLVKCKPHQDVDLYKGKDRIVWLSAFDSDEFALSTDGTCFVDELIKYNKYHGLMLPWFCVGHSNHFLTPPGLLVTEAYTHRMDGVGGLDKAFNRFYSIVKLPHSHVATFKGNKLAVDEWFEPSNYDFKGKYPAKQFYTRQAPGPLTVNSTYPKYRLYHYMTKSVEHLVKKWSRGQADFEDEWGRSLKRPLKEIIGWLKGFAVGGWNVSDETALPMAKVVRTILHG